MRSSVRFLAWVFSLVALVPATRAAQQDSGEFKSAFDLFNAKRFPEAAAAFESILSADPKNAAAHHYLGRTILKRNDKTALEEALASLARAVELEPDNAVYLGIYGGASLQLAGRTHSLSAANKGREAMEQALRLDPNYLEAREGLFQFYQRAPWPVGSAAKAKVQLEEIRKRDPDLATILEVGSKTNAREYAAAFKLCEDVLRKNPDNYTALYHFGRTASISGQNLERGLTSLQRCLQLDPPTPAAPSHSNVSQRIGNVLEQLNRPTDARAAYHSALELDPANRQAADALRKLQ